MHPNILIVKLSSLGDVIHTFPAAWRLRQAFPGATLGWVVEKAHRELLDGLPWIDERIVWEQRRPGSLWALRRDLRQTRWDLAVDFQGLARSAVVARLSGAPRILGFRPMREFAHWLYTDSLAAPHIERHAVERSLLLAAAATRGLEPAIGGTWRFHLSSNSASAPSDLGEQRDTESLWDLPFRPRPCDEAAAQAWLANQGVDLGRDRLVVLFPDCRNPTNRWPLAKFSELGRRLLELPAVKVILAGAKAAGPMCATIHEALAGHVDESFRDSRSRLGETRPRAATGHGTRSVPTTLTGRALRADGQFGLLGTAALLQRASAIVAGDTGPGHLAVALGLGDRLVSLFGPTNPARTGPYSQRAIVVSQQLSCSPCLAKRACPLGHAVPPCMGELDVARVQAAVLAQLSPLDAGGEKAPAAA